jgi:nitrile hydratase beta subunit
MDGVHDMGGADGFGAVAVERDEPVFHHPWEALGYGLGGYAIDVLRMFNWDEARHAIERMEPQQYLAASYYERIITGVASLFVEKGLVTQAELEHRAGGRFPLARPVATTASAEIPAPQPAGFAVGDTVVVRKLRTSGHIRMPAYVRGKPGVVIHVAPPFSFPDAAAHGRALRHEPTYHVRFDASALWDDAAENSAVVVDLWQSYLERA